MCRTMLMKSFFTGSYAELLFLLTQTKEPTTNNHNNSRVSVAVLLEFACHYDFCVLYGLLFYGSI